MVCVLCFFQGSKIEHRVIQIHKINLKPVWTVTLIKFFG